MPLNWDDDEEDLTDLDYRKPSGRVLIHEEVTARMDKPSPSALVPAAAPSPQETRFSLPTAGALSLLPASSRDRFAAFFLDTLLGFYLYWVIGFLLSYFFETANIKVLHQSTGRYALHWILTLGIFFFYYLLTESVFGATLGKMFCRLRVVEISGTSPSLGNVFIRNFLRILDYPLLFLIAVISMESSPLNQRLGDRAANTMVIKKTRRHMKAADLRHTALASTLSRVMAEIVDLLISLTLVYSIIWLMNPKYPQLSFLLFLSTPAAFFAYFTLSEFLLGTTPGKAVFKRRVVLDNGLPPDGTSAVLRNLFRPLDYLLGYPLLVLSKRKQRLGDMAADTLVIVSPVDRKSVLGAVGVVLVVILLAYFGFTNPNHYIRKQYGLGPVEGLKVFIPNAKISSKIPRKEIKKPEKKAPPAKKSPQVEPAIPPAELPETTSKDLKLTEFYFATGPEPAQIRHDRVFRSGDLIYLFFKMEGFRLGSEKEASLSEDLQVENPEGKIIVKQPQVVQLKKSLESSPMAILFANNIDLPKNSPKGKYRVIVTVYDHNAQTQYSFDRYFEIQ